ncbi:Protein krueppel [Armadillidium vulgare]|nr:Protein krueppel [Armadillidium vulgare]
MPTRFSGLHVNTGSRSAIPTPKVPRQLQQYQSDGGENAQVNMVSIRSRTNSGLKHHCSLCIYSSNSKQNVRNHIMFKHTGERPFMCEVCHKRFTLKQHLRLHLRTHTGERPHKCTVCPRSFTQKGHLKSHILSHHC